MLHVAFIRCFMIKIYQTSMFKLGLLCLTVDAFFFIHRAWKLSRNCLIARHVFDGVLHISGHSGFAALLVWSVSPLRLSCCVKLFPRVFGRLFLKAGQRGPHGERESRKTCLTNTTNNRWRRLSSASDPARRRKERKALDSACPLGLFHRI